MHITLEAGYLILQVAFDPIEVERAKLIPKRRYLPTRQVWKAPAILPIFDYIERVWPNAAWAADARDLYHQAKVKEQWRQRVASGDVDLSANLAGIPFKHPPYDHQRKALILGRDMDAFAYLMDQGTGKTKTLIDDAAHNYREQRIDGLLVISPNSVKTNWVSNDEGDEPDEIAKHMAPDIPYEKGVWFSNSTAAQRKAWSSFEDKWRTSRSLLILSVNVESLHVARIAGMLERFCQLRKVMIVVDESTRIKNRTATRSKMAVDLRKLCPLARIMSGTPIIQSPLDAYSQFYFLDPDILGFATYAEFSSRYAVPHPTLPGVAARYINLDELSQKIAGSSYRVRKEDCLDLPPKVYLKRAVHMNKEQQGHYDNMRTKLITYLDIKTKDQPRPVVATMVMTQMLRLQQIVAGHLPVLNPDTFEQEGIHKIGTGMPPKVAEAIEIIEDNPGKVIVWCRFRFEIEEMAAALKEKKLKHVLFYGDTSETERSLNRKAFQDDDSVKVFVGQIRTGGIGLNLYKASTVIYLSNTFSAEDRLQSEDRAHRIGQVNKVTYYDLVTPRTVDERVLAALRNHRSVSDEVMRDGYSNWM